MKNFWLLLVNTLILTMLFCGCSFNKRDLNEPVKIGVILPLSGAFEWQGNQVYSGMQCAYEQIKASSGGDTLPPKLIVIDDRSIATNTDLALRRLAAEGVAIALVGYNSTETLSIKSTAKELRLPVIAPTASHDDVSINNKFMFQLSFNDSAQAKALAYYAFFIAKSRNLAFLLSLDEDDVYSRDLGRLMAQEFSDYGGLVVGSAGFVSDAKDYKPILRDLLTNLPDSIFIPTYAKSAGRLVAQLRELGYSGLIIGSDGWLGDDFVKNCGPNPAPAIFSCGYANQSETPEQQEFIKLYTGQTGHAPGVNAAMGYDAMNIAYLAAKQTTDYSDVLERLSRLRSYSSVGGDIRVLKEGAVRRNIYINRVINSPKGDHTFKLEFTIKPNHIKRIGEEFDKENEQVDIFAF